MSLQRLVQDEREAWGFPILLEMIYEEATTPEFIPLFRNTFRIGLTILSDSIHQLLVYYSLTKLLPGYNSPNPARPPIAHLALQIAVGMADLQEVYNYEKGKRLLETVIKRLQLT